jgi:hypothetical protein
MQSVLLQLSKMMIASVHTPCGDRPLPTLSGKLMNNKFKDIDEDDCGALVE